jgi:hypothetical protein
MKCGFGFHRIGRDEHGGAGLAEMSGRPFAISLRKHRFLVLAMDSFALNADRPAFAQAEVCAAEARVDRFHSWR